MMTAVPLSAGAVVTVTDPCSGGPVSCIQCPYHHFAFADDGRIAAVPTDDGSRRWPKRPVQRIHKLGVEDGNIVISQ